MLSSIGGLYAANFTFGLCAYSDEYHCGNIFVTKNETIDELVRAVNKELASKKILHENVASIQIHNPDNNTKIGSIPREIIVLFPKLDILDMQLHIAEISASDFEHAKELLIFSVTESKRLHKLSVKNFRTTKLNKLAHLGNC